MVREISWTTSLVRFIDKSDFHNKITTVCTQIEHLHYCNRQSIYANNIWVLAIHCLNKWQFCIFSRLIHQRSRHKVYFNFCFSVCVYLCMYFGNACGHVFVRFSGNPNSIKPCTKLADIPLINIGLLLFRFFHRLKMTLCMSSCLCRYNFQQTFKVILLFRVLS